MKIEGCVAIVALIAAVVFCQTVVLMYAWNWVIVGMLNLTVTKLTLTTAFGLGIFLSIVGGFFTSSVKIS